MIIPFFIFNFIYGLLAIFFYNKYGITWCNGDKFLYNLIVQPFVYATDFFGFNSTSWFVLMLLWVELFTYILYLLFKRLNHRHIIITLLTFFSLLILIHMCRSGYRSASIIFFTRTIYMMFWLSVGIIYKKYLEKYDNIPNLVYYMIIFLIQYIILIANNGGEMNAFIFNSTFTKIGLITIILAANGIALYLRLSKILCASLENSKIVTYIQKNSFSIMMHQMFDFFVLNLIFLKLSNYLSFIEFDYGSFISNQFYRVNLFGHPAFRILYASFGLAVPLSIAFFINYVKRKIKKVHVF